MLDGKEVEGKIGEYGGYYVDASSNGKVKVGVEMEVDLVKELKKLAAKTETKVDDNAIAWVEGMINLLNPKPVEG